MTGNRPRVLSSATVFLVADVVRAAEYYRDALGFHFHRFWGDPPAFCMVWRNESCVMLSLIEDAGQIRPVSTVNKAVWDAYFWVDDVDRLFNEFEANGARTQSAPSQQPYGVREFVAYDLDGYQLAFGQDTESESDD